MFNTPTTRRSFLAMSTSISLWLAGCGAAQTEQEKQMTDAATDSAATSDEAATSTGDRETITDDTDGGHAIAVSAEEKTYESVDVIKTGDDDGDEADFYGTNAAVYAEEGATLTLKDITVTTDGAHANAVFSYGEGTTVNISDSTIDTTNNCSGGIMVTGGGLLNATNLTIHTTGNSSASIRSDRGGGTQVVSGGTYTTDGTGSPVIYSTADVTVSDATLTSTASQGVVVEGKNSASLVNCDLVANNNTKNSDKSDWYQAVMIYQSMSGDATQGEAHFSAQGGSITNANGDIFFVNNTVATIDLAEVSITNDDQEGNFLRAAAAGWGNEGSNGGQVTVNASKQQISGVSLVDEVSHLNLVLSDGSTLAGAINPDGRAGDVYVELQDGCTWELTADSHITALTCGKDAIALNGYALYVGDDTYAEGTASTGEAIEATVSESTGGPGGGEPPSKPGEGSGSGKPGDGGEPPAKPDGESGEPPAKPDSEGETSSTSTTSSN
ncbi:MAG: hypothetical protein J6S63_04230 [Atopobiaceae bacterium]|nr:hypothetical protein [Atopobiaceae bacterium]